MQLKGGLGIHLFFPFIFYSMNFILLFFLLMSVDALFHSVFSVFTRSRPLICVLPSLKLHRSNHTCGSKDLLNIVQLGRILSVSPSDLELPMKYKNNLMSHSLKILTPWTKYL
jgi:hypothetical protein